MVANSTGLIVFDMEEETFTELIPRDRVLTHLETNRETTN